MRLKRALSKNNGGGETTPSSSPSPSSPTTTNDENNTHAIVDLERGEAVDSLPAAIRNSSPTTIASRNDEQDGSTSDYHHSPDPHNGGQQEQEPTTPDTSTKNQHNRNNHLSERMMIPDDPLLLELENDHSFSSSTEVSPSKKNKGIVRKTLKYLKKGSSNKRKLLKFKDQQQQSSPPPPLTEITPLLLDEGGETGGRTFARRRGHPVPQSTERSRAAWAKVRKHVLEGDFLLMASPSQPQSQSPTSETINHNARSRKNKSKLVQDAIDEIRSGLEFSLGHGLVAIGLYLALSIVCYNVFLEPEWTMIDACYFAVTTFTTVGYGDEVPTSSNSMIFTCIYALTGVACLGIALGIIGSNLMDAQEKAVSKTREMTQVKVLSVFGGGVSGTRSSNESNYNEANNPPEDNTDDKDDDDAFTAPPSCMGFVLHAIPLLTVLFGLAYSMGQWLTVVANFIMEGRAARFRQEMGTRELTQQDLDIMDADGDGVVTRAEFLEFMLVAMNKIDEDLVQELRRNFDRLDADGTGQLSRQDLVQAARQKLKTCPKRKLALAAYKEQLLEQAREGTNSNSNGEGSFWRHFPGRQSSVLLMTSLATEMSKSSRVLFGKGGD